MDHLADSVKGYAKRAIMWISQMIEDHLLFKNEFKISITVG